MRAGGGGRECIPSPIVYLSYKEAIFALGILTRLQQLEVKGYIYICTIMTTDQPVRVPKPPVLYPILKMDCLLERFSHCAVTCVNAGV